ncbi:TonB-dependent receptor [uncultured Duncaniella sp.]|uniref:SusC/RagA family TonB-linked outer membrane protein n=2 Tax=uncultured Duncaniella sp. TaxID=2768039 RepID=UPI00262A5540|nr:TonB-dependent receptor [uncultured Duncaniella sp.]
MKHFIAKISLVLLAFLLTVPAFAQDIVYQGTVVDSQDEPLIGATVRVPDTKIATITDFDGNFTIKVPKGKHVEVSYIGYLPAKITDFNQKTIVLREDSETLDEVVVVGYGTQKKAHLTGAISTVPMDDIKDLADGNLASSLSGLVNGLSVVGGDARPGDPASVYVRGVRSLGEVGSTVQQPLFVIDGVVYNNDVRVGNITTNPGAEAFNNLDPNDVESITVLKDASAAVYGSRAANGVILVTTKKGKLGEPVISYSGTFGFTDAISNPKMLSAYNYGRLYNAMKAADPTNTTLNRRTDLFQADELNAMRGLNYDLLDENWKTGFTMKHNVGVSGATEKANYYASIGYYDQDGNLGKLDYNRWNYRAGVDLTLKKWVKANVQISGDYGDKNNPLVKVGGTSDEKQYNMLLTHPRYIPEYVNGYPMAIYGPTNVRENADQDYSFSVLQNSGDYSKNKTSNFQINTGLELDFGFIPQLKGLKARFNYSKSINTSKTNQFGSQYDIYYMSERAGSGSHLYTPIPGEEAAYESLMTPSNFLLGNNGVPVANGPEGGFLNRTMNRSDSYQMNFTVNYNRDFGPHSVGALFSIEKSEFENEYLEGQVTYPYEFGTNQSNSVGQDSKATTVFTRSEAGSLSYIFRANYAYSNKYLLEALLRIDSSTKFAPENYWGAFPSVSAGWVISEEDFFKEITWIDFLKIRASYGLTGRDNTVAWQWLQTYGTDKDKGPVFGTGNENQSGSHISMNDKSSVNRNAHWDKSHKFNAGIDLNVLHSHLNIAIDGYYTWDREMLMPFKASVPGTVGITSAPMNYGKMNQYGIELSATWRSSIGKDFRYKVGLNTGLSDNKVLLMDWETDYIYRQITRGHRSDMGVWGMQCLGMFRSFQDIDEYFAKYNITSYMGMSKDQVRPGMLIYKDVRGPQQSDGTYAAPDGVVDRDNDMVQLSNRSNPYGVTLNLNAEYKNFSITAQLSGQWGGYTTVPTAALKPGNSIEYTNVPSFWNPDNMFVYEDIYDAQNRLLMEANRNAYYPNLAYSSVNSVASTFWRISAASVRLTRLTLAYSIPSKLTKMVGINSARFNVTGQNLLNFLNPYPDHFMSPMAGNYGNYPNLRRFTVGVNLSF